MIPLIIAYILNIIDYIFTAHWVRKFGIEIETNPIGRWLFSHNIAWICKILILGGIFVILGYFIKHYREYAWISYIPLGVYGLIVIYHIIIYFTIRRY